jgi:hypothetical protein
MLSISLIVSSDNADLWTILTSEVDSSPTPDLALLPEFFQGEAIFLLCTEMSRTFTLLDPSLAIHLQVTFKEPSELLEGKCSSLSTRPTHSNICLIR